VRIQLLEKEKIANIQTQNIRRKEKRDIIKFQKITGLYLDQKIDLRDLTQDTQ